MYYNYCILEKKINKNDIRNLINVNYVILLRQIEISLNLK